MHCHKLLIVINFTGTGARRLTSINLYSAPDIVPNIAGQKPAYSRDRAACIRVISDGTTGMRLQALALGKAIQATGHPASVMDMSFANQALAAEWIKENYKNLESKVYTLPKSVDQKIAATKLKLMGGQLEILSDEQLNYLDSWEFGTS